MGLDQAAQQGPGLLPSQLSGRNVNNMGDYAQKVLWASYENQGWSPDAARDAFLASMPKYGAPAHGSLAGIV